jgi:hypothetical protein
MPCNSEYMAADGKEIAISQVACLLDELDGEPINSMHWSGYHPRVYNRYSESLADALVAELCGKLQKLDVAQYSLEMQIWWRDHQKADKERLEREIQEQKEGKDRDTALAKLSPYERKLLGL